MKKAQQDQLRREEEKAARQRPPQPEGEPPPETVAEAQEFLAKQEEQLSSTLDSVLAGIGGGESVEVTVTEEEEEDIPLTEEQLELQEADPTTKLLKELKTKKPGGRGQSTTREGFLEQAREKITELTADIEEGDYSDLYKQLLEQVFSEYEGLEKFDRPAQRLKKLDTLQRQYENTNLPEPKVQETIPQFRVQATDDYKRAGEDIGKGRGKLIDKKTGKLLVDFTTDPTLKRLEEEYLAARGQTKKDLAKLWNKTFSDAALSWKRETKGEEGEIASGFGVDEENLIEPEVAQQSVTGEELTDIQGLDKYGVRLNKEFLPGGLLELQPGESVEGIGVKGITILTNDGRFRFVAHEKLPAEAENRLSSADKEDRQRLLDIATQNPRQKASSAEALVKLRRQQQQLVVDTSVETEPGTSLLDTSVESVAPLEIQGLASYIAEAKQQQQDLYTGGPTIEEITSSDEEDIPDLPDPEGLDTSVESVAPPAQPEGVDTSVETAPAPSLASSEEKPQYEPAPAPAPEPSIKYEPEPQQEAKVVDSAYGLGASIETVAEEQAQLEEAKRLSLEPTQRKPQLDPDELEAAQQNPNLQQPGETREQYKTRIKEGRAKDIAETAEAKQLSLQLEAEAEKERKRLEAEAEEETDFIPPEKETEPPSFKNQVERIRRNKLFSGVAASSGVVANTVQIRRSDIADQFGLGKKAAGLLYDIVTKIGSARDSGVEYLKKYQPEGVDSRDFIQKEKDTPRYLEFYKDYIDEGTPTQEQIDEIYRVENEENLKKAKEKYDRDKPKPPPAPSSSSSSESEVELFTTPALKAEAEPKPDKPPSPEPDAPAVPVLDDSVEIALSEIDLPQVEEEIDTPTNILAETLAGLDDIPEKFKAPRGPRFKFALGLFDKQFEIYKRATDEYKEKFLVSLIDSGIFTSEKKGGDRLNKKKKDAADNKFGEEIVEVSIDNQRRLKALQDAELQKQVARREAEKPAPATSTALVTAPKPLPTQPQSVLQQQQELEKRAVLEAQRAKDIRDAEAKLIEERKQQALEEQAKIEAAQVGRKSSLAQIDPEAGIPSAPPAPQEVAIVPTKKLTALEKARLRKLQKTPEQLKLEKKAVLEAQQLAEFDRRAQERGGELTSESMLDLFAVLGQSGFTSGKQLEGQKKKQGGKSDEELKQLQDLYKKEKAKGREDTDIFGDDDFAQTTQSTSLSGGGEAYLGDVGSGVLLGEEQKFRPGPELQRLIKGEAETFEIEDPEKEPSELELELSALEDLPRQEKFEEGGETKIITGGLGVKSITALESEKKKLLDELGPKPTQAQKQKIYSKALSIFKEAQSSADTARAEFWKDYLIAYETQLREGIIDETPGPQEVEIPSPEPRREEALLDEQLKPVVDEKGNIQLIPSSRRTETGRLYDLPEPNLPRTFVPYKKVKATPGKDTALSGQPVGSTTADIRTFTETEPFSSFSSKPVIGLAAGPKKVTTVGGFTERQIQEELFEREQGLEDLDLDEEVKLVQSIKVKQLEDKEKLGIVKEQRKAAGRGPEGDALQAEADLLESNIQGRRITGSYRDTGAVKYHTKPGFSDYLATQKKDFRGGTDEEARLLRTVRSPPSIDFTRTGKGALVEAYGLTAPTAEQQRVNLGLQETDESEAPETISLLQFQRDQERQQSRVIGEAPRYGPPKLVGGTIQYPDPQTFIQAQSQQYLEDKATRQQQRKQLKIQEAAELKQYIEAEEPRRLKELEQRQEGQQGQLSLEGPPPRIPGVRASPQTQSQQRQQLKLEDKPFDSETLFAYKPQLALEDTVESDLPSQEIEGSYEDVEGLD